MSETSPEQVYRRYWKAWQTAESRERLLRRYGEGAQSFVPDLLPEQALQIPGVEVLELLQRRLGPALTAALDARHVDPAVAPADLPRAIRSPVASQHDGDWLRTANVVGVNIRTVGTFWGLVKYALTLPAAQDAVHLLPIWEPGVVASLYGMSSWQLNPEFYSPELARLCPHLDGPELQLRAAINILHAMGKTVGMDVIPHTDRFSEMAFAQPCFFEWLQRQDTRIVNHEENLHLEVQAWIMAFLADRGPAIAGITFPPEAESFFDPAFDEAQRLTVLFGRPADFLGRRRRRIELLKAIQPRGYEPVPATMAPPYRGLVVDPRPAARRVDENGLVWRDYVIADPRPMSRVFGPLARYKLYGRRDDNARWEIDFERPLTATWAYVCERYASVQRRFGFDFMRGDMSHVQMRPEGVPHRPGPNYDILLAVKRHVHEANEAPYFAYLAESFLAPRDVMSYGSEIDHLEASEAEVALGDLQSTALGSEPFLQRMRQYLDIQQTRDCTPCFTVITADKDDPRFDEFYVHGNAARLFIGLLLTDLPSYTALGFETRDIHHAPAPNEHYSKLFVFQETIGPKATSGPYVWGRNGGQFARVLALRELLDRVWPSIAGQPTRWLLLPDPTAGEGTIAWTQDRDPSYIFVVNTKAQPVCELSIPALECATSVVCWLSTASSVPTPDRRPPFNGRCFRLSRLAAGEARAYAIEP